MLYLEKQTPVAIKSIKQNTDATPLLPLMETFRSMINDCIRIGLEHDVSTKIRLCKLCYHQLEKYEIVSYYKVCAISHAAGILANREKSIKRGFNPRRPYSLRRFLTSFYGFKVADHMLRIPIGNMKYFDIQLNNYVSQALSDPSIQIRSFTLTSDTISICYSKEVEKIVCTNAVGIDRNLRNLTVGNHTNIAHYDLSKTVDIAENTRSVLRSFQRDDIRIRRKLYAKYGKRRKNRANQILHKVSKRVVQNAKESLTAVVFEDIARIRQLYKRGNGQGRSYRGRLNDWSFAEIKRQIEYKAAWEGVPVIQLTKAETKGTSQLCPQCGKKITQADRRQLYCAECKKWMDRDMLAAVNISIKGLARFASSQGLASEAMKGNPAIPVILRVDASKLDFRY